MSLANPSPMLTLLEPNVIIGFLVSYLTSMQINYITVFNCWLLEDNRYLLGNLTEVTKFVQLVDLNSVHLNIAEQVHRLRERDRARIGVLLEFGCPSSKRMLHECAQRRCFSTSTHWILLDQKANDSALEELAATDLYVDAELKVLSKEPNGNFSLLDVYNNGYSLGGQLNVTFDREVLVLEDGRVALGESRVDAKSKYQNRNILSDIALKVEILTQMEENGAADSFDAPGMEVAARIGYMLTRALEIDLKFKVEFVPNSRRNQNISFVADHEAVVTKLVDFGVSGVMQPNTGKTTTIQNFMTYRSMFLFRTPASHSFTDNIFTQPFAKATWIAIVLTIVIGGVAVKINFLAENRTSRDGEADENYPMSTMITESLANFCQEGCEFINRSSPGRLSQMMLFICSIVVFNYYSSGFFSILMQGPQMSKIKTIEHLTGSQMPFGIDATAEAGVFFRESTHSDVRNMLKHSKGIWDSSPPKGIEQVRQGRYAYHCDAVLAYSLIRETFGFAEMCDLNEVQVMPSQWVGLVIRKDSPFRELFTIRLARLREVGAFKRFSELWIIKKPGCFVTSVISSISLDGALPLFLLLIAGIIAAFFAFIYECGLFRVIGRRIGSSVSPIERVMKC